MSTRSQPGAVKYQSKVQGDFARSIARSPGCEHLMACIQCGTCSATCPLSGYMDLTPRRIIAMTRAGFEDEVLRCRTVWLCASCYSCAVECPKQIKVTELMYAIKQRAMRARTYPPGLPMPILAREFFDVVRCQGRNNEALVMMRLYLKTNPFRHVGKAALGLRLWLRGRLGMTRDKIANRRELQTLLQAAARTSPPEPGPGSAGGHP